MPKNFQIYILGATFCQRTAILRGAYSKYVNGTYEPHFYNIKKSSANLNSHMSHVTLNIILSLIMIECMKCELPCFKEDQKGTKTFTCICLSVKGKVWKF